MNVVSQIKKQHDLGSSAPPWVNLDSVDFRVELPASCPLTTNLIFEIQKALKKHPKTECFIWDDLITAVDKRGRPVLQRFAWPNDEFLLQQHSMAGRLAVRASTMQALLKQGVISRAGDTGAAALHLIRMGHKIRRLSEVFRFVGSQESGVYEVQTQIVPPRQAKSISIIINYRDKPELTCEALGSIFRSRVSATIEVILVSNQSSSKSQQIIRDYCASANAQFSFQFLSYNFPYNHSAQSNLGANQSESEVLIFLNNDARIISPETLQMLADWSLLPGVATVGPRILGEKNQIVSSGMGIVLTEKMQGTAGVWIKEIDHQPLSQSFRSTAGNSFACAAISRKSWDLVGHLDEVNYPTQYNDAEYIVRAMNRGLRHFYCGYVDIFHQPGASGGKAKTEIRQIRAKLAEQYSDMAGYGRFSPRIEGVDSKLHFGRVQRTVLNVMGVVRRIHRLSPKVSQRLTEVFLEARLLASKKLPEVFGRVTLNQNGL